MSVYSLESTNLHSNRKLIDIRKHRTSFDDLDAGYSGYVYKKSDNIGQWRKRFMLIKNLNYLEYYDDKNKKLRGSIDITTLQHNNIKTNDNNKKGYGFSIKFGKNNNNKWELYVETEIERQTWIAKLNNILFMNEGSRKNTNNSISNHTNNINNNNNDDIKIHGLSTDMMPNIIQSAMTPPISFNSNYNSNNNNNGYNSDDDIKYNSKSYKQYKPKISKAKSAFITLNSNNNGNSLGVPTPKKGKTVMNLNKLSQSGVYRDDSDIIIYNISRNNSIDSELIPEDNFTNMSRLDIQDKVNDYRILVNEKTKLIKKLNDKLIKFENEINTLKYSINKNKKEFNKLNKQKDINFKNKINDLQLIINDQKNKLNERDILKSKYIDKEIIYGYLYKFKGNKDNNIKYKDIPKNKKYVIYSPQLKILIYSDSLNDYKVNYNKRNYIDVINIIHDSNNINNNLPEQFINKYFKIIGKDRIILFACESDKETKKWVKRIQNSLK